MNKLKELVYVKHIEDIKSIQHRASKYLIERGVITGNTMECNFEAHYVTATDALKKLLPEIRKRIPKEVWEIEKKEYATMERDLVKTCKKEFRRDSLGRRGIALHHGCISYQHCYVRRGTLVYVVHMRGMDTRKYIADIYYMLHAANAVALQAPKMDSLNFIHLHLLVDCFHSYTQETPL